MCCQQPAGLITIIVIVVMIMIIIIIMIMTMMTMIVIRPAGIAAGFESTLREKRPKKIGLVSLRVCLVPEPQPVPVCATGLMQGSVNFAAVSHRFLVRGRSLAGHGLAMASDFCPKIGRLSKNWPGPAPGQF